MTDVRETRRCVQCSASLVGRSIRVVFYTRSCRDRARCAADPEYIWTKARGRYRRRVRSFAMQEVPMALPEINDLILGK